MSEKYLYLLLFPNQSLIASQLEPSKFAQHYAQGSAGFFGGNFLFIEVDSNFRNDYFKIDTAYADLTPHEDGRPKATKFICNYRTLEHMDFSAFKNLYYCNSHGNFVELVAEEYDVSKLDKETDNLLNIYLDISPTKMVVLSRHSFTEYGLFKTNPESLVSVPAVLYTQVRFDIVDFLTQFEHNPFLPLKIPGIHPARLRDYIHEVQQFPTKRTKGISLDCPFDQISYRSLLGGFMFASQVATKFYPLVSMTAVEKNFYQFWKSM